MPGPEALFDGTVDSARWSQEVKTRAERLAPQTKHIEAVYDKYISVIERQYNKQMQALGQEGFAHTFAVGSIRDANDRITDKQVIEFYATEFVDQSMFALEDRLPECVEGVEIHYIVVPPPSFL